MPDKAKDAMSKKPGLRDMLLLIAMGFAAKLLFFLTNYPLVGWDGSVFLGMGKYIYSLGSLGLWEIIRPPALALLLGGLWKLGLEYITAAHFLMALFSAGCLLMTYLIGTRLYGRKAGLLAGLMLFFTPVFFLYSNMIMTGIPSLFFCLLSLYLAIRKRYVSAAIFSSVAFFFRYPAGLIFAGINLIIIYQVYKAGRSENKRKKIGSKKKLALFFQDIISDKNFIRYNLSFISLMAVFLLIYSIAYGSPLEPLLLALEHQSSPLGNVGGINHLTYYFFLFTTNITLAFVIFAIIKDKARHKHFLVLPLAVFLIYFTMIPHKQERFALLFLPYLALLASYGFFASLKRRPSRIYKFLAYAALILMFFSATIDCLSTYQNFPDEKPGYIDNFYRYFEGADVSGPILVSEPMPAAYTDHLYIPYYQNPKTANIVLDENLDDAYAIIYTPSSFPWNDTDSRKLIEEMEKKIRDNTLVAKHNDHYEIYLVG